MHFDMKGYKLNCLWELSPSHHTGVKVITLVKGIKETFSSYTDFLRPGMINISTLVVHKYFYWPGASGPLLKSNPGTSCLSTHRSGIFCSISWRPRRQGINTVHFLINHCWLAKEIYSVFFWIWPQKSRTYMYKWRHMGIAQDMGHALYYTRETPPTVHVLYWWL